MATKISFNSNGVISSRAVQIHYLTAPNLVRYGCGRGMTVGGSTVWTMTNAYTSSGEKKTSIGRGSFMVSAQSLYGYNVGGNGATATFKQQLSEVLNTSHYYYFSCYHGTNSGPTVTISTAQGSTQTIATLPSTSAAYTTDFYSCIFKPTYSQMSYLTFNVPSGVTLYFTRIMLFDLTAMGISVTESNKSTWKTYVDTYLRENRTIVGMGDSSGTSDSYLIYTPGGWASSSDGFTQTDFPERCWTCTSNSSSEKYLYSTSYMRQNEYFYAWIYGKQSWSNITNDWYFPEAEPSLTASIPFGSTSYWSKISAYGIRSNWSAAANQTVRFDVNSPPASTGYKQYYSYWGGMWRASSLIYNYNAYKKPSGATNVTTDDAGVNKYFFDCHWDGWSQPILHLPNPNYKKVSFDNDCRIHCTDVIINPTVRTIHFDEAGRLYCAGITDDFSNKQPYPIVVTV